MASTMSAAMPTRADRLFVQSCKPSHRLRRRHRSQARPVRLRSPSKRYPNFEDGEARAACANRPLPELGPFPNVVTLSNPHEERDMDWNRVEGNWKQLKGKVKEKWGKLTDDDLDVISGKRDQLEGKIQERYGWAKDQVRKDVDDWYGKQRWDAAA
jgi:uncharacterized protein YjbJ (UPF0337 family)